MILDMQVNFYENLTKCRCRGALAPQQHKELISEFGTAAENGAAVSSAPHHGVGAPAGVIQTLRNEEQRSQRAGPTEERVHCVNW